MTYEETVDLVSNILNEATEPILEDGDYFIIDKAKNRFCVILYYSYYFSSGVFEPIATFSILQSNFHVGVVSE